MSSVLGGSSECTAKVPLHKPDPGTPCDDNSFDFNWELRLPTHRKPQPFFRKNTIFSEKKSNSQKLTTGFATPTKCQSRQKRWCLEVEDCSHCSREQGGLPKWREPPVKFPQHSHPCDCPTPHLPNHLPWSQNSACSFLQPHCLALMFLTLDILLDCPPGTPNSDNPPQYYLSIPTNIRSLYGTYYVEYNMKYYSTWWPSWE